MSKVICDICGTAYPSNAKKCPICGSSREYALDDMSEDVAQETAELFGTEEVASVTRKKGREIFDYDEVNQEKNTARVVDDMDFDDEEDTDGDDSRVNVGLVIILVILIVLLLLTSAFFFVRYLLPNMMDEPVQTQPVVTTEPVLTEPVETTTSSVPCTNLSMDGGKMELAKDGKKLLNVRAYPENTTDTIVYSSADESVVTVSEDGTVTAVGEGQTVVTVQCGNQRISCSVTVDYATVEETVAEGEIPALQVDGTDPTDATDGSGETQATEEEETVPATEETESTTGATESEQKLKLKKTDITISSNYTSVQLELEGDIKPENVKWFTMDSTIAICHNGVVTSTGSGLTRIYGEYNGEQVMCIVRCIF